MKKNNGYTKSGWPKVGHAPVYGVIPFFCGNNPDYYSVTYFYGNGVTLSTSIDRVKNEPWFNSVPLIKISK